MILKWITSIVWWVQCLVCRRYTRILNGISASSVQTQGYLLLLHYRTGQIHYESHSHGSADSSRVCSWMCYDQTGWRMYIRENCVINCSSWFHNVGYLISVCEHSQSVTLKSYKGGLHYSRNFLLQDLITFVNIILKIVYSIQLEIKIWIRLIRRLCNDGVSTVEVMSNKINWKGLWETPT